MMAHPFPQAHPAFKRRQLEADKMLDVQNPGASFMRKTAHTFAQRCSGTGFHVQSD
jgi:hypothetical protein